TRGGAACRKSDTLQGEPISACCAGQKFLPPGIPLGTKLSAEPRTRPCGLAHSQRSISLYVSRPSAHVGWTGLVWQFVAAAVPDGGGVEKSKRQGVQNHQRLLWMEREEQKTQAPTGACA